MADYIDQWASKRKIDIPEAAFRHAVSVYLQVRNKMFNLIDMQLTYFLIALLLFKRCYLQECKSKNKSAEKMKKQRIARMGSDCEGDSDSSKGKNENQQMLDNDWTDGFD